MSRPPDDPRSLVSTAWLAAASAGLWVLWRYDNTPGEAAHAPEHWPASTALTRATDRQRKQLSH